MPEGAIRTDQGEKHVFVVDDQNRAVYRRVVLGATHDHLRIIEQGLQPSERVIINGLHRVRPGSLVEDHEASP